MKILVVDNVPAAGSVLTSALRAEDRTVEVSTLSGEQWVRARYLRSVFDLVLLDFDSIPSGADTSRRARVLWLRDALRDGTLPRLVVIAQGGSELLAVACMKVGAADYLPRRLAHGQHLDRLLRGARRSARGVPEAALDTHTGLTGEYEAEDVKTLVEPRSPTADVATLVVPRPPVDPEDTSWKAEMPHVPLGRSGGSGGGNGARPANGGTSPQPVAADRSSNAGGRSRTVTDRRSSAWGSAPALPRVPGYQVLRPLGQGGMASVFLAKSEELGENVVLKVLMRNAEETFGGDMVGRFESEYQIIASMNSLRIVDIFDFGLNDDYAFIAMEYFPAGDLQRRMRNPVAADEAVAYGEQILEALAIVHGAGVLHRDLKPANVMLREDNSLALIDFGISKSDTNTKSGTATGTVLGTPFYASPEQLGAEAADTRSDLYSAGVILFELLTGEKPFTGNTAVAIVHQHMTAPIPRLPASVAPLQAVVDALLAKKPQDRIASADVALKALRTAARGLASAGAV